MTKLPELSMAMADERVDTIEQVAADIVTGCDHGCLMNIEAALMRKNSRARARHIASVLAGGLT